MFRKGGKGRVRAAVTLTAVLALGLAAPAGAKDWGGWSEAREWAGGLLPRVLGWLGVGSDAAVKDGAHVDPNGGPKDGPAIDPNGGPKAVGTQEAPSGRDTTGAEQSGRI
jgi:hypothetical protein